MALPHQRRKLELLCVNLSGQSVSDRQFHAIAVEMLERAGNKACRQICLEITETAAITNMADAIVFIDKMRALGVRIALDDFGAGASSFSYLKQLRVDYLKVDGQFIQNLHEDVLSEVTVKCFVELARAMEIQTIAEYVDCAQTLELVTRMGIDFAQGFYLHQPEPMDPWLGQAEHDDFATGCEHRESVA